jgi:hypothetical protein
MLSGSLDIGQFALQRYRMLTIRPTFHPLMALSYLWSGAPGAPMRDEAAASP